MLHYSNKVSIFGLCFVLCFVLVSIPFVRITNAQDSTLVVPDEYSTIQLAINNADDGDTVYVKSGLYYERLTISKPISLIGESKESTTVRFDGDPTILVKHDSVNVTGFTIKNAFKTSVVYSGFSALWGARSGIHLLHVKNCNIYDNSIVECGCGIWFYGSENNNVFGNTVMNCSFGVVVQLSLNNFVEGNEISSCHSGLLLSACSFNVFENNVVENNFYSFDILGTQLVHYNNDFGSSNLVNGKKIYFFGNSVDLEISPEDCPNASLVFIVNCVNITVKNLNLSKGGLYLVNSSRSTLSNNNITETQTGISLRSCSDITISNNTLRIIYETAILLESSDRILINYNNLEYTNKNGISLVSSNNNNITKNLFMENTGHGVILENSHKNTLFDNVLTNIETGIRLMSSAENIIKNNKILNPDSDTENLTRGNWGIWLRENCDKCQVIANTIVNCRSGIVLEPVSVCVDTIGNNITNCGNGLLIGVRSSTFASNTICNSSDLDVSMFQDYYGLYNTFYNNNFINNAHQTNQSIVNDWVCGSNGNYWSNYNGADLNGDGVGDTPHVLDDKNQDIYPLIVPVERFDVGTWGQNTYYIDLSTNSIVTNFVCNPDQEASIKFNVDVQTGNHSFCRVTIPKDFMDSQGNWVVLVNDEPVSLTITEEIDNTFLNFTYDNTAQYVEIIGTTSIPEFSSWIVLPLSLIATLFVSLSCKKLSTAVKRQ